MFLRKSYKGTATAVPGGGWSYVQLDNRKRNARIRVKLSTQLTQAGGVGGAVKNGGSALACVQIKINENGNDTYGPFDGFVMKQIAEFDAGQPLDFVRLPASAALPVAVYSLEETLDIIFSKRQQAIPAETSYLEANPNQPLQIGFRVISNALPTLVGPGNTQTLGTWTLAVEQEDALVDGAPLPLYKPFGEVATLQVAGASTNLPMDLRITNRIQDLVIYGTGTDADGGTIYSPSIINALALRGTGSNQDIIGPDLTPFDVLVNSQREFASGDVAFLNAFYQHTFTPFGTLPDVLDPTTYTNLRLYLNVSVPAGLSAISVNAAVRELTVPATVVQGYPMVVQGDARPAWAR